MTPTFRQSEANWSANVDARQATLEQFPGGRCPKNNGQAGNEVEK